MPASIRDAHAMQAAFVQAQKAVSLAHRKAGTSPTSHRARSPDTPYPWETRINAPPPVPREKSPEPAVPTTPTDAVSAAAEAAYQLEFSGSRGAAEKVKKKAQQREDAKKFAAKLRQRAVDSAGREAVAAATSRPPTGTAELQNLRERCLVTQKELQALIDELNGNKQESLKRQLGEAIVKRADKAQPTDKAGALMKEWDKNGDGELSLIEFKQAVRLSLNLRATNEQIDELFQMFDGDGGGSIALDELRPAIQRIFDYCYGEHERETYTRERLDYCAEQLRILDECTAATRDWEQMKAQVAGSGPRSGAGSGLEVSICCMAGSTWRTPHFPAPHLHPTHLTFAWRRRWFSG